MPLRVTIFGKNECGKCAATKSKVSHVVGKLGIADDVEITHIDMDSEDGIAEGAFRDVLEIPTTIINDGTNDLARWSGVIPDSAELRDALRTS